VSFRHHLVRWAGEYAGRGLAVVEVSGGELATFDDSARRFRRNEPVTHPVLWDRENQNHKNYAIRAWPSTYLIGPDGKVFWQGNAAAVRTRPDESAALRQAIEEQLKRAKRSKD
jgi:hypothetical protein